LRTDLEFCIEHNIIHFPQKKITPQKDKNGNVMPIDPRDEVNSMKIEMFKLVSRIDADMCRWRASLSKGKPVCA